MTVEMIPDAKREGGWWLLVDSAEQSFVDIDDPMHLEFEYVQMIAHVLQSVFANTDPITALHLGGGLCTLPRWLVAGHPGSRQRIVEHSAQIAKLSRSLGPIVDASMTIDEASAVVARSRRSSADLVVCDIYDGPDTVTEMFSTTAIRDVRRVLRPDGIFVCNLSDAAPLALTKVVVATLRSLFGSVVLGSEPAVLRGRRSGNLVLAAADRELPVAEISRRAAGGPVRFRVVSGDDLAAFAGSATPAEVDADLPPSGESAGRPLR
jgi:spermidine synthase